MYIFAFPGLAKWILNVPKFFCIQVDELELDVPSEERSVPVVNPPFQERSACFVSTHFHSDA